MTAPIRATRCAWPTTLRLGAKVDILTGTILSHVGLAVADYARQHKVFFLASAPLTDKIVWESGNRYTFRLRPSTYSHAAALVPHAAALKRKRWAFVYPNYEYGQSAVATFKELLKKAAARRRVRRRFRAAARQGRFRLGRQSLADAKPDAIFNVLFGADLAKFVREGETRGLFKNVEVVSLLTGEPEYLDPLKDEAPTNWYVTGYPWYLIKTPEHMEFLNAYQKRYNDYPRISSVVGYATIKALAAGIDKANPPIRKHWSAAFEGLTFRSPSGNVTFRALDHQATLGLYVGRTALKDSKGVMSSFDYLDGSKLQPSDEEVRKMRPADLQ